MPRAKKAETGKAESAAAKSKRGLFERAFADNDALSEAIEAYFTENAGQLLNEFALAMSLGISSVTLRKWKADDSDPQRKFIVQQAYDRITADVIAGAGWNDKFMQQKAKQVLESDLFAGYNTKTNVKADATIHVQFGKNMDEECMK